MIKILKGSVFDSKCDLLVVPCNNYGGITSFVRKELLANNIPIFTESSKPGDIFFYNSVGDFSNASVIGYAAAVDAEKQSSSKEIIRLILQQIKSYCELQSLSKINIPLLGTGAGGLSPIDSFSVMKEEFESNSNCVLCVYAISNESFLTISNNQQTSIGRDTSVIKKPRVFISYTGIDAENKKWVKWLCYKLREAGVDAHVDMFHLKPGQDLPQWMTNEIIMADKVILIGDKYYAEKADNRKGGVGWETMLIQGDMLNNQLQDKYVVIVRTKDIDAGLPIYIKSKYSFYWYNDETVKKEFDNLLLYLYDCDDIPPVGDTPEFIKEKLRNKSFV